MSSTRDQGNDVVDHEVEDATLHVSPSPHAKSSRSRTPDSRKSSQPLKRASPVPGSNKGPSRGPSPANNVLVEIATVAAVEHASGKKRRSKSYSAGLHASHAHDNSLNVSSNADVPSNGEEKRKSRHSRNKSSDKTERSSKGSRRQGSMSTDKNGSKVPPDEATINDLVVHGVLRQFLEQASIRVAQVTCTPDLNSIGEHFRRGVDPVFERLLQATILLAQHGLDVVVDSVYNWRLDWDTSPLTSDARASIEAAQSSRSSKEVLEERKSLVLDFILVSTLLELLRPREGLVPKLSPSVSKSIETLSLDRVKGAGASLSKGSEKETSSLVENKRVVLDLFIEVLGALSRHRFQEVSNVFIDALNAIIDAKATKNKLLEATPLARGLGSLHIDPARQPEAAVEFLDKLIRIFKSSKRIELKHALCASLNNIVTHWTEDSDMWRAVVANEELQNRIQPFYDKAVKWSKKTKHTHATYPLVTVLVSVMKKSFFDKHSWEFMQSLMKLIRDKPGRESTLQATFTLIRCSLLHSKDDKDTSVMATKLEQLKQVSNQIFAFGKKYQAWPDSVYDLLVKVILEVADHHLDFAIQSLVMELLQGDSLNDNVLVGLRALAAILKQHHRPTPEQSEESYIMPQSLKPYLVPISDQFAAILKNCDTQLGTVVGTLHSRSVNDVVGKDKMTGLTVFRHALKLVPFLWPGQLTRSELAQVLLKCTDHLDPQVKRTACEVLDHLIKTRPRVRSAIVHEAVEFIGRVPDSHPDVAEEALERVHHWLTLWDHRKATSMATVPHHRRQTSDPPPDPLHCAAVEGIALVFLCSARASTRDVALRVLKAVSSLSTALPPSAGSISVGTGGGGLEPRIQDVIEATQSDIVRRSNLEKTFVDWKADRDPSSSHNPDMTLARLASKSAASDQKRWAVALGDLACLCHEMCPAATKLAWTEVCARLSKVRPSLEKPKVQDPSMQTSMYLWRNFVVFGTASAPDDLPQSGNLPDLNEIKRQSADIAPPITSVEDLFRSITPYLSSPVYEHQIAAAMALGRTRPRLLNSLFYSLASLEKEIAVDAKDKAKGSKKKKAHLRTHIVDVYRQIAEHCEPGAIIEHDLLLSKLLAVAADTLAFLSQLAQQDIFLNVSTQDMCLNLSKLVSRLCTEVQNYGSRDSFPAELRRKLWHFFAKWCGHGPLSQEVRNMKEMEDAKLQDLLDKDREKKGSKGGQGGPMDTQRLKEYYKVRVGLTEYAALCAMGALLLGPAFDDEVLEPNGAVLTWISSVFEGQHYKLRAVGQTAVENLMRSNPATIPIVIDACYSSESQVAHGHFRALTQIFGQQEIDIELPKLLHVILYTLGDGSKRMRTEAIALFQYTATRFLSDPTELSKYALHSTSVLPESFLRTRVSLSKKLARDCPTVTFSFLTEAFKRLKKAPRSRHRAMLEYMVPWMSKISFLSQRDQDSIRDLLNDLLEITMDHRTNYQDHLPTLWASFAGNVENVGPIIDFLVSTGMAFKAPGSVDGQKAAVDSQSRFLECAKRIVIFISRVSPIQCIDKLVSELSLDATTGWQHGVPLNHMSRREHSSPSLAQPRHRRRAQTVAVQRHDTEGLGRHNKLETPPTPPELIASVLSPRRSGKTHHSSTTSVDEVARSRVMSTASDIVIPTLEKEPKHHRHETGTLITLDTFAQLTRANLAMMLLCEVAYECGEDVRPYFATVIHVATLCLDHPLATVHEHAKQLIVSLAQSLVIDTLPTGIPLDDPRAMPISEIRERARSLIDFILSKRGPLWPYEDISIHRSTLKSHREISNFVTRILQVFGSSVLSDHPLEQAWSEQALGWIISTSPRHLANRSCQIFRVLCQPHMARAGSDFLDCLSRAMNPPKLENLRFSIELLMTLKEMVGSMDPSKLILFPQFFWSSVALLHTEFIPLFRCTVELLTTVIETLNLEDTATHQVLSASMPREWSSRTTLPFRGFQPLLLKGLHSEITEPITIQALQALTAVPSSEFIHAGDTSARLVWNLFCLLPWLIANDTDTPRPPEKVAETAFSLAALCEEAGAPEVGNVLIQFGRGSYSTTNKFVQALASPLSNSFFPTHHKTVWNILHELLKYGLSQYTEPILSLLDAMLRNLNLKEASGKGDTPSDLRAMLAHISGLAAESPTLAPLASRVLNTALLKLSSSGKLHSLSEVALPTMGSVYDDDVTESDPSAAARKAGVVFTKDRSLLRRNPLHASRLLHEVLVTIIPTRRAEQLAPPSAQVFDDLDAALLALDADAGSSDIHMHVGDAVSHAVDTISSDASEALNMETEEKIRALLHGYQDDGDET